MAAGLGLLRLAPSDFWSMTPRELAAAIDGALGRIPAPSALARPGLDALMARYPDSQPNRSA